MLFGSRALLDLSSLFNFFFVRDVCGKDLEHNNEYMISMVNWKGRIWGWNSGENLANCNSGIVFWLMWVFANFEAVWEIDSLYLFLVVIGKNNFTEMRLHGKRHEVASKITNGKNISIWIGSVKDWHYYYL